MFSVVIPMFNKADFVERAIESVLAQTLPAGEIVVVDDGSTDGSGELVLKLFGRRVTLVSQENLGEGAARNRGISQASGKWVALLDADDVWLPGHLAELSRVAQQCPRAHLIASRHVQWISGSPVPPDLTGSVGYLDYFRPGENLTARFSASSTAVRRSTAIKLGGFGFRQTGEDRAFWARVALQHPVASSTRVTSLWVRANGGVSEQMSLHRRGQDVNLHGSSAGDKLDTPQLAVRYHPAAEVVLEALASGTHVHNPQDLMRYIEGLTRESALTHVREGSYRAARETMKLSLRPYSPSALTLTALMNLPDKQLACLSSHTRRLLSKMRR